MGRIEPRGADATRSLEPAGAPFASRKTDWSNQLPETRKQASARLAAHLAAVTRVRSAAYANPADTAASMRLKAWQSDRLGRTYPDLLASARYHDAARFFLNELYGPKDFSQRDVDVERILPKLTALLPAAALSAIADAVELDEISEVLDQAVLRAHGLDSAITETSYAAAYRAGSERAARARQITLTQEICTAVDKLTHIPMMLTTLKLMRAPAKLAGLFELQRFLEIGFTTFKGMKGAEEFIGIILRRESRLMERLFAGVPDPFAGLAETG